MDNFIDGLRVLIADDHQMTIKTLRDLMIPMGFRSKNIEQAEDGEMAYAKIIGKPDELQFNIVILDWYMPGMTGIEVLKKCMAEERFNKIVFVMLTAEVDKSHVINAIKSGAKSYIHKPFTVKEFEDKIKKILDFLRRSESQ